MSDFGSGHDLMVREFEPPPLGSALTARSLEPVSDSVSPSLSAPPLLALSLSLSLTKIKINIKNFFQKVKKKKRKFILSLPGRFELKTWKMKGAMLYSKEWLAVTVSWPSKNPPKPQCTDTLLCL